MVKTLGRSSRDAVNLTTLLADEDSRDAILEDRMLVEAVLERAGQLSISPQFFFYILTTHVLKETGCDRVTCDYIASLLETFTHSAALRGPLEQETPSSLFLCDMLVALQKASPVQAFLIRSHVGNYALFVSGVFHENVAKRSQRGAPTVRYYEEMGRSNFLAAAEDRLAHRWDLAKTLAVVGAKFREIRLALNHLSETLLDLDAPTPCRGLLS